MTLTLWKVTAAIIAVAVIEVSRKLGCALIGQNWKDSLTYSLMNTRG
jgi:hypothetical protein